MILLALFVHTVSCTISFIDPATTLTSFPTYNLFDNPHSFSTASFSALVIPIYFIQGGADCIIDHVRSIDNLVQFKDPQWSTVNHTLFYIDWVNEARAVNCARQDAVLDQLGTDIVPRLLQYKAPVQESMVLLSGKRDYMYDVAGPYNKPLLAEQDGMATTPDAAVYIKSQLITRRYLYANITREPGVWNVLHSSLELRIVHWTIFAGNLSMLLFGVCRLVWTLRKRTTKVLSTFSSSTSSIMAKESNLVLTINGIVFLLIACLSLMERYYNDFLVFLTYFYWLLTFWTIGWFNLTWSRVAYRVLRNPRYKRLAIFVSVNMVLATVITLGLVMAILIPTVYKIFPVVRILFYLVLPFLYLVQSITFIVLAIQFLSVILEQPISSSVIKRLRQMTITALWVLAGNAIGSIGAVLYQLASSPESYYAVLILLNVAGWIAQMGAFIVHTNFEEHELHTQPEYLWTGTNVPESDAFHDHVPLSALGVKSDSDTGTLATTGRS